MSGICVKCMGYSAVLDEIYMLTCYGLEENTDAREATLKQISRLAAPSEGDKTSQGGS